MPTNEMSQKGTGRGLLITVLLIIIGFAAVDLFSKFVQRRSNADQRANMEAAKGHLPELSKLLKRDGKFDKIELLSSRARGGCLRVQGTVESEEKLQSPKDIVSFSNPPVTVDYHVSIESPEQKEMIKQYLKEHGSK
jgi:hypothetical protein